MAKDIKLIACRNCGKEIRADTKYCPFCSVENIDVRTNEADIHHPNKTHTVPVPKTVPINKEETKPLPTENADAESLPKEENLTCSGTSKKEMDKSYKKKKSKKTKKVTSQKNHCTIGLAGCMDAFFFVLLVMVVGIGVFCVINPETRDLILQTVKEVSYELQQP